MDAAVQTSTLPRPDATPSTPIAAPELAGTRVLIVHHWLYAWAGAERCLEQLVALMPHADVIAGIVTPEMRREHAIAARAREPWVARLPFARTQHRWFLPLHGIAFHTLDTSAYDLIVSVSHGFEKAVQARKRGAVHVSYCLSPPRFLWDLADAHEELASPLQRGMLRLAGDVLRRWDLRYAAKVDRFVSLSRYVADRVRRRYGRDSAVVYPPVTAKVDSPQRSRATEPFLLTIGRLVPYKRVDLAVAAAERLGVRLVVAGDGPERHRLERLAGPHTTFLGTIDEVAAARLLSDCAAFVFCPEDDFGIAPVEANAHGAPVVAFGRGGVRETMVEGETAIFFEQHTVDALSAALTRCLSREWDPAVLMKNASRFSAARFRDGMRSELVGAMAGDRRSSEVVA
jgi:glycosyltransferase involved in cell wall biosynthesis